jgi:hypothetical protein
MLLIFFREKKKGLEILVLLDTFTLGLEQKKREGLVGGRGMKNQTIAFSSFHSIPHRKKGAIDLSIGKQGHDQKKGRRRVCK